MDKLHPVGSYEPPASSSSSASAGAASNQIDLINMVGAAQRGLVSAADAHRGQHLVIPILRDGVTPPRSETPNTALALTSLQQLLNIFPGQISLPAGSELAKLVASDSRFITAVEQTPLASLTAPTYPSTFITNQMLNGGVPPQVFSPLNRFPSATLMSHLSPALANAQPTLTTGELVKEERCGVLNLSIRKHPDRYILTLTQSSGSSVALDMWTTQSISKAVNFAKNTLSEEIRLDPNNKKSLVINVWTSTVAIELSAGTSREAACHNIAGTAFHLMRCGFKLAKVLEKEYAFLSLNIESPSWSFTDSVFEEQADPMQLLRGMLPSARSKIVVIPPCCGESTEHPVAIVFQKSRMIFGQQSKGEFLAAVKFALSLFLGNTAYIASENTKGLTYIFNGFLVDRENAKEIFTVVLERMVHHADETKRVGQLKRQARGPRYSSRSLELSVILRNPGTEDLVLIRKTKEIHATEAAASSAESRTDDAEPSDADASPPPKRAKTIKRAKTTNASASAARQDDPLNSERQGKGSDTESEHE